MGDAKQPAGDDEMFRERIAYWAGILDLHPSKWSTVAVLARVSGSLLAGIYRSKPPVVQTSFDPKNDIAVVTAIAYVQPARFNR